MYIGNCANCGVKISTKGHWKKYCNKCSYNARIKRNHDRFKRNNKYREENNLCRGCGKSDKIINNIRYKNPNKPVRNKLCLVCYLKNRARVVLGTKTRWKELLDLYNKQNGLCYYSNRPIKIGMGAELDHSVSALSAGTRTTTIDNLKWIDYRINNFKGSMCHNEFIKLIKDISIRF